MSPDDPGVMGNLPRSRPGRRSSKRGGDTGDGTAEAAKPTKAATGGKSAAGRTTAKKASARRSTGKRTTASGGRPAAAARTRARETPAAQSKQRPPQGGTDPITGAVMLAGKVVEGGLKVAGGIIKRLPRP